MLFANKIGELLESKQMLQRHLSAALDMDNAMYGKIEKGDPRAKREQVHMISEILHVDPEELLIPFLADKVTAVFSNEKDME